MIVLSRSFVGLTMASTVCWRVLLAAGKVLLFCVQPLRGSNPSLVCIEIS